MSKKFFYNLKLRLNKEMNIYLEIIDWLIDKEYINYSNKNVLINKINNLEYIKENFICDKIENLQFPKARTRKQFLIIMNAGEGKYISLLKHIRNAIAHSLCEIVTRDNITYFEIKDYGEKNKQTAYMFFKVEFLKDIYEISMKYKKK